MVGGFMDAVAIGVESRAQHTGHQNPPLSRPGSPQAGTGFFALLLVREMPAGPGRDHLFQNLGHGLPQFRSRAEVLQSAEDRGDALS